MQTVLIAGHETTSAMLTWTILQLGENPEILQRLRNEIDSVVGDSPAVTAAHLEAMPYLRAVLKESLRMHPPVTIFSRQTVNVCNPTSFFIYRYVFNLLHNLPF